MDVARAEQGLKRPPTLSVAEGEASGPNENMWWRYFDTETEVTDLAYASCCIETDGCQSAQEL